MSVPISHACSPAAMQFLCMPTMTHGMPAARAESIACAVQLYRGLLTR